MAKRQPEGAQGSSPFHAGELAMQRLANVRESAERVASAVLRDFMPEQHREFFAKLPYVVVGSEDAAGRPWASFLCGQPGFIAANDARTLTVRARAPDGDDLDQRLKPGARVALLGVELHTRRRNRANGRVSAAEPGSFTVQVEQSFGNCPKHITPRVPRPRDTTRAASVTTERARLSARARSLVAMADTFFIASSARSEASDPRQGVDVSHRGGHTGFVTIESDGESDVLSFLDYPGNALFNTLGNVLQNPRVGLTFVDFDAGDLLLLTGEATIVFEPSEAQRQAGGERAVRVRIVEGALLERALPWSFHAT